MAGRVNNHDLVGTMLTVTPMRRTFAAMQTKIIEATNVAAGGINYGKFMLGRFDREWERRPQVTCDDISRRMPLLMQVGWGPEHLMVMDLQTGEGAIFRPGGLAAADLNKHRVWVCPLFEPFLAWLYKQDLRDLTKLPDLVEIPNPKSALQGYRRPGPDSR